MSELRANTISNAAGTGPVTLTKQSAAKAWVNFNGIGTIAARDSFNVASLTDNGTGDYAVNFSSAMGNENYSVSAGGNGDNDYTNIGGSRLAYPISSASSSPLGTFRASDNSRQDNVVVSASFHGDLA